jgi:hypothetical protein
VPAIAQTEFVVAYTTICLEEREDRTMKDDNRWLLLTLILSASALQSSCGYVAAGAAGAAIQHEVSEREDEEEEQAENQ